MIWSSKLNKVINEKNETEPDNITYQDETKKIENPINWRANAVKRIAHQRNKLLDEVGKHADMNDYILYSDNDEIPNLDLHNFIKVNSFRGSIVTKEEQQNGTDFLKIDSKIL